MRNFSGTIILVIMLLMQFSAFSEVYLLGRKTAASGVISLVSGTEQKPLYTEKVVSGEYKLDLEIYDSSELFSSLLKKLQSAGRNTVISANSNNIRSRTVLQGGLIEHLLIVRNKNRSLIFRLLLPKGFVVGRHWHNDLPQLPGGAVSELVLELPERKAVFGMFRNAFGNPSGNLRAVLSNLSAQWRPAADESQMLNGRGAFLVGKNNEVMLINFAEDGTGFFYRSK